jgi:hypothetical protein
MAVAIFAALGDEHDAIDERMVGRVTVSYRSLPN